MTKRGRCESPDGPPASYDPIGLAGGELDPGDLGARAAERSTPRSTAAHLLPLPCPKSHNSTDDPRAAPTESLIFPGSAKRTAHALQLNVTAMVERHGLERVGFLTLTFADHVLDPHEAQRRMNSLTTHVLRPRYGSVIRVLERQKSGRIHYHLLVNVGVDIRTGCDFTSFAQGDYRSAPRALRGEWAFWRATAKAYGFGRTELLPVRSTSTAIGKYVGKYIAKHLGQREGRDRRVRLVSYVGTRVASTRFAWAGGPAALWRLKLAAFVGMLHQAGALGSPTLAAMRLKFGPRWAHHWRDQIATFPLDGADGTTRG